MRTAVLISSTSSADKTFEVDPTFEGARDFLPDAFIARDAMGHTRNAKRKSETMYFRRKILLVFTIAGISVTGISDGKSSINCPGKQKELDKQLSRIEQLKSEESQLTKQFSDSVEKDFSSQVEGVVGELHRNKALKVAYAKKRLARSIASTQDTLEDLRKDFCTNCIPDENVEQREKYCKAPTE